MSIKETLKILSKQLGVYHYVRYSKIYHKILEYKNPTYIKDLDTDLAFYRNVLGDSLGLVFDVGANRGDKTWAFRQIAKKVVCFEPDKTCFETLSARYGRAKSISLENYALGEMAGTETFFVEEEGSAYNTLNKKERDWLVAERKQNIREVSVPVSTLDIMIEKYGNPDFLKIDVEGGEVMVFKGLNSFIPVICFEANLPRFREETISIIDGFSHDREAKFNLRLEDDFVFSSHRGSEDIISVLNRDEELSFDVFVFRKQQDY